MFVNKHLILVFKSQIIFKVYGYFYNSKKLFYLNLKYPSKRCLNTLVVFLVAFKNVVAGAYPTMAWKNVQCTLYTVQWVTCVACLHGVCVVLQVRGEERVAEEQRRSRDLQARLERERQLELENFTIRYATLEQVCIQFEEEDKIYL